MPEFKTYITNWLYSVKLNELKLCLLTDWKALSNPFTRQSYPFAFEVRLTYLLRGNRLTISQEYHNTGDRTMPFSFGFHPYFRISELSNLTWEIRADAAINMQSGQPMTVTQPFSLPYALESGAYFTGAREYAVFTDSGTGHNVKVGFDRNSPYLVLWSLTERGFVCVEPWNGAPDSLNSGNCSRLAPGKALHAEITIEI